MFGESEEEGELLEEDRDEEGGGEQIEVGMEECLLLRDFLQHKLDLLESTEAR